MDSIIKARALLVQMMMALGNLKPYNDVIGSGSGGNVISRIKPDKDNVIWYVLQSRIGHNDATGARNCSWYYTDGAVTCQLYGEVIASSSLGLNMMSSIGGSVPIMSTNSSHLYAQCSAMAASKSFTVDALVLEIEDIDSLLEIAKRIHG
jgi:hypothetical protein